MACPTILLAQNQEPSYVDAIIPLITFAALIRGPGIPLRHQRDGRSHAGSADSLLHGRLTDPVQERPFLGVHRLFRGERPELDWHADLYLLGVGAYMAITPSVATLLFSLLLSYWLPDPACPAQ